MSSKRSWGAVPDPLHHRSLDRAARASTAAHGGIRPHRVADAAQCSGGVPASANPECNGNGDEVGRVPYSRVLLARYSGRVRVAHPDSGHRPGTPHGTCPAAPRYPVAMHPRWLRTWLWRLNPVLLVIGICVWAYAASLEVGDNSPYQREIEGLAASAEAVAPPVSRERMEAFLEVVRIYHGAGVPVGTAAATEPQGPVRPPLASFKVALFIRDGAPAGNHGLVLRCQDPAHPEVYFLSPSRADRGTALRDVRFFLKHAEFDVTRGKESFTFRAPLRPRADLSVLRARGDPRPPTGTSRRRGEHRAEAVTLTDASAATSLKILSHRDTQGRCVGIRITGLRPGGWADEFGFHVGDIIETEAAAQLKDPQTFRSAVRSGWRPTRVTVQRDIWGETHKLSVDGT